MIEQAVTFGQWLKAKREERGLTLRDVERITEGAVSNPALSQIETGKIRGPSIQVCGYLAAAYGLDEAEIFNRAMTGNKPRPRPEFCPHCGQLMDPDKVVF